MPALVYRPVLCGMLWGTLSLSLPPGHIANPTHQLPRPFGPDLIPVRSDLAERELGLLLIDRHRYHLSALHMHRIVREDRQPIPPP